MGTKVGEMRTVVGSARSEKDDDGKEEETEESDDKEIKLIVRIVTSREGDAKNDRQIFVDLDRTRDSTDHDEHARSIILSVV